MKLDDAMKKRIRDERLLEYSSRMYVLELDIAAQEAIGDAHGAEHSRKALEGLKKAYEAVEVMQ